MQRGNDAFASGEYDLAAGEWNALAEAGDQLAQYNLGLLWQEGLGSTPKNEAEAAEWFYKSAQQGYPPAMVELAKVQQRLGSADASLSWYVLAARWGNADAIAALSDQGEPVPAPDLLLQQQEQHALQQQQLLEASRQLGEAIGCALGGGCQAAPGTSYQPQQTMQTQEPPIPRSTVSPTTSLRSVTESGCTSDFSCGFGNVCIKQQFKSTGKCFKSVDEYGTPTYAPPRTDSIGPNIDLRAQCQFSTHCPVGFRCDSKLKVCVK